MSRDVLPDENTNVEDRLRAMTPKFIHLDQTALLWDSRFLLQVSDKYLKFNTSRGDQIFPSSLLLIELGLAILFFQLFRPQSLETLMSPPFSPIPHPV